MPLILSSSLLSSHVGVLASQSRLTYATLCDTERWWLAMSRSPIVINQRRLLESSELTHFAPRCDQSILVSLEPINREAKDIADIFFLLKSANEAVE